MSFTTFQFGLSGIRRIQITERQFGRFGILTHCITSQQGRSRIANAIAGYNVYVGSGALPDLTQPPSQFSATLPIYVSVTPPLVGTLTFFVLVRAQNQYGIESQNSRYTTITINSAGALVRPTVPIPQSLGIFQQVAGGLKILAAYPTVASDLYPATVWKVWAGLAPPDPTVDIPVMVQAVKGKLLSVSFGIFAPGDLVYVKVGLYRQIDMALSPTLDGQITILAMPIVPIPVLSGYQE